MSHFKSSPMLGGLALAAALWGCVGTEPPRDRGGSSAAEAPARAPAPYSPTPAVQTPPDHEVSTDDVAASPRGDTASATRGSESSQDPRRADSASTWSPDSPYTPGAYILTDDPAWDHYSLAQRHWQKEVQDLVMGRRPDLRSVSRSTLMMQWSLLDRRGARIRYLLAHDPGRFVRDRDLAAFINFEWTPADDEAIRQMDPDYVALENRIETLGASTEGHPDYGASREFLKELLLDPEFRETVARFADAGAEVEDMLGEGPQAPRGSLPP